jgi:parallel beta-helix repeat protein
MKRLFIVIVTAMMLVAGSTPITCAQGNAQTLTVGDGREYLTIQAAVNAAQSGDTIIVYRGTYYENILVDKSLTLTGIGNPIIDGGQAGDCFRITMNNVILNGFKVTNATPTAYVYAGIILIGTTRCQITDNIITNSGQAIILRNSNNNIVSENKAYDNTEGIGIDSGYGNVISSNTVSATLTGIGLGVTPSCHDNTVYGNIVSNCKYGIGLWYTNGNIIERNTAIHNTYSIYLEGSNDNIVAYNKLSYNDEAIAQPGSSGNILTDNKVKP